MIASTLPELGGKESSVVCWKLEDPGKNAEEDEAALADNKLLDESCSAIAGYWERREVA